MLFNSLPFVAFFLIVFGLYYLPFIRRYQRYVLLIASAVFYGWQMPRLLLLLLFSVLLNSIVSFRVARSQQRSRRGWATFGIVANLALLSIFKYGALVTNLLTEATKTYIDPAFFLLHIPLPIGISFYTFEGISLLVDVLQGRGGVADDDSGTFGEHLSQTALFIAFSRILSRGRSSRLDSFIRKSALRALGTSTGIERFAR